MHGPLQNLLLAALPEAERRRLIPELELVELAPEQTLHVAGDGPRYAYFPNDSIVSLALTGRGASTEVAVVGYEGMVGVSLFLGEQGPLGRATVICPGHAYRIGAADLARWFDLSSTLKKVLLRYTQALLTQMAQTAVCNRRHSIEQQLCRWLLLATDRQHSDTLLVTQESISAMLGVRREGVTEAAGRLRSRGLIIYKRGHITILDRNSLEMRCCECYRIVKGEFERLVPGGCSCKAGDSVLC